MLNLSSFSKDIDRLESVVTVVRNHLDVERVRAAVDVNPFAAEQQVQFSTSFLRSVATAEQVDSYVPYRDWLAEQRLGPYPIAYQAFSAWPECLPDRARIISTAHSKVRNALQVYLTKNPIPHFKAFETIAWGRRLEKYERLRPKFGDLYSMLGGILTVESLIDIIESMLVCGFPDKIFVPPRTFSEFLNQRGELPGRAYYLFKSGSSEETAISEFLSLWRPYRNDLESEGK